MIQWFHRHNMILDFLFSCSSDSVDSDSDCFANNSCDSSSLRHCKHFVSYFDYHNLDSDYYTNFLDFKLFRRIDFDIFFDFVLSDWIEMRYCYSIEKNSTSRNRIRLLRRSLFEVLISRFSAVFRLIKSVCRSDLID
jgi:hypothetical protein